MRVEAEGDVNRVHDQVQFENARREREQREARQAAEVEYLDEAGDYREYRARRADRLIVEPRLPDDEMTMADYKTVRELDPETLVEAEEGREYVVVPEEPRR